MADEYSKEDGPGEAPPGMMGGLTYCEALTEVTGRARNILEKWSDIPANEVVQHVNALVCYNDFSKSIGNSIEY